MTALLVIVLFLGVMAAADYFKSLDPNFWRAWRTPLAAGVVAGALLWPLSGHPAAAGIVLSLAALYVRLMGRESESIDGMLLGACTGAAAAAVLSWRVDAVGECIAAGAVAGYGITYAAFHVRERGKQIAIDVVTALAAVGAAYAPRALAAAGVSTQTAGVAIAALMPVIVIIAVFREWPELRAELRHEASLGFLDDADVRRTAHPILRLGGGGWTDRRAHREFVRLAIEIALRKRRQRFRSDDVARLYQLEIIKLRMQLQEMSRIDRDMRDSSSAATMTSSK
ncbi:MAG TPA: hypothetical protein VG323_13295 [Thermoanaerobaculia bacterium]|nr:hypothetical protein [Thermoanaerobaculia bacterium]